MGRRSINTTKSGKYMNPTDQARKEARKRELKKNKKQRMLVRQAVLKGKDPLQLLTEMEIIDQMEYNPVEAPKLNEKVLKDKRRKLKETFQRVYRLYEKENPEYAKELRKAETDYEKKRMQLQLYFEQVKNAERVQLDQIPLPDIPQHMTIPSLIPLPNEIPLPSADKVPHGILKKSGFREITPMEIDPDILKKRKPPGPPPGPPPELSDSEDEEYDPEKGIEENIGTVDVDVEHPHDSPDEDDHDDVPSSSKSRKIRFMDDDTRDPDEEEKDTRLKFKAQKNVTALQAKMLQMAGQKIPEEKAAAERKRRDSSSSSSDSDSDDEDRRRRRRRREDERDRERERRRQEDDEKKKARDSLPDGPPGEDEKDAQQRLVPPGPPPGAPPGLPQGLPPGPPPGAPPMMFRPMRGPLPRMLPPGPPPGRPSGLPPGPPPGLPPNIRLPPRMPPGPPGVPPPRMLRPPGAPPGMPPPRLAPPGTQAPQNPNVISAQPSIMKPPQRVVEEEKKKSSTTIEAKPQIKNVGGDATRFTPVALKVKRDPRDAKGRVIKKAKEDEKHILGMAPKSAPIVAATHTKTKDDAYDQFMREMEDFI